MLRKIAGWTILVGICVTPLVIAITRDGWMVAIATLIVIPIVFGIISLGVWLAFGDDR